MSERKRAVAVLVAAVVLQLALPGGRGVVQYALITASYALVGGWLVVNLGRRAAVMRVGLGLLAAGWMLNLAPIAANGAMPVSLGALREVNPPLAEDLAGGELDKHVVAGSQTRLNGLGDIVPVAPFETVVSLGDIVMCIGIVLTTATGMASVRGCRRRTHREEESI